MHKKIKSSVLISLGFFLFVLSTTALAYHMPPPPGGAPTGRANSIELITYSSYSGSIDDTWYDDGNNLAVTSDTYNAGGGAYITELKIKLSSFGGSTFDKLRIDYSVIGWGVTIHAKVVYTNGISEGLSFGEGCNTKTLYWWAWNYEVDYIILSDSFGVDSA
ncbi:MAG: hypothetical protein GF383_08660, partial [Candidatus Lokiarchaeota archaeon]|nr:hypothetical protein [Candidatus Lokiarchaeota archaeon]